MLKDFWYTKINLSHKKISFVPITFDNPLKACFKNEKYFSYLKSEKKRYENRYYLTDIYKNIWLLQDMIFGDPMYNIVLQAHTLLRASPTVQYGRIS